MTPILSYIDAHREDFVERLAAWVRIPSISADPEHKADVAKNARFLADELRALGADRVEIWPTPGHPAVFASWNQAPGKPTVLVYGHHDVQPADPLDEWISPPFEPAVREGRIWGRGVVDDKGQVMIHLKAIEAFIKTRKKLPLNVKLIVEGEEEIGSEHFDALMRDKAKDLEADTVCVSDTAMFGRGIPSLCIGLRGLMFLEIYVDGPSSDLHSGSFGGGVTNPINALARILSGLHDTDGHVTVPGFYETVRALTRKERDEIAALPFDEKQWLAMTGSPAAFGEKGYSTLERVWTRPTLDCNGISGGHQGAGAKTIVPARAMAKVSCRLVADQEPEDIYEKVARHVQTLAPPGVRVRTVLLHGGRPYVAPTGHPVFEIAKRAFSKAFGKPTVFIREGGSIPFVRTIADVTGKPCLLMGFGQPDENAHAPNEWLLLENFHLGIKSVAWLYEELSRQ